MFDKPSRELIARCLELVAAGAVLPESELGLLLGFTRDELPPLAALWRDASYGPEMIRAGHSVLGNLTGYPLDTPDKVYATLGTSRDELKRIVHVFLEREKRGVQINNQESFFDRNDRELIALSLEFVARGTVFPQVEVATLLGFETAELEPHARAWRREDYGPEMKRAARSVLGNLTGYPLDGPTTVYADLGTTLGELKRVLSILCSERPGSGV